MCGRYALIRTTADLERDYEAQGADLGEWQPRGSVNITAHAPVLLEQADEHGELERALVRGRWRFVPQREEDFRPAPLINARLDKLQRWSGWRESYIGQRCGVPMSGYFEFIERLVEGRKVKQPYFISDPSGEPLLAAGLYSEATDPKSGFAGLGFTIITTDGVDAAGEIHDRMPVFLPADVIDDWLALGEWDTSTRREWKEALGSMSAPIAARLKAHPTSRALNNTRTVDVHNLSLVEPVDLD
ncbi:SOS response-associated peptidase [Acaricomes phytoseiuli]|uniref:SOS response-associated peptidase n=1 Tax=Acaricomes phytoseiuli TaxID=291968 RepID=UPI00037F5B7B|nr:SOS response-associated peptidase [Acaricomes phytoseiuli]